MGALPYDPGLAERLKDLLGGRPDMMEKKMFGGIGWMLGGNMCVGVYKEWLIVRVGEGLKDLLNNPTLNAHAKAMDITGKPMKGWGMVAPEGVAEDDQLAEWTQRAIDFVQTLPVKA
ncbi:MAG: TfoX/Sxy family protein [Candidatus Margulisiibacteriota bacterium]